MMDHIDLYQGFGSAWAWPWVRAPEEDVAFDFEPSHCTAPPPAATAAAGATAIALAVDRLADEVREGPHAHRPPRQDDMLDAASVPDEVLAELGDWYHPHARPPHQDGTDTPYVASVLAEGSSSVGAVPDQAGSSVEAAVPEKAARLLGLREGEPPPETSAASTRSRSRR